MKRITLAVRILILFGMLLAVSGNLQPGEARDEAVLELEKVIETGGTPDAIVVDHWGGREDILFYDLSAGEIRFIDGKSLTLTSEAIPISNWAFEGWMVYDENLHQTYFLSTHLRGVSPNTWNEVRVNVINSRSLTTSFSINQSFNQNPSNPTDERYSIDGVAFKQAGSEGNNPGRLFVDNTPQGNIDVVDLSPDGREALHVQRFSYRSPLTTSGWQSNQGNSLALETRHESLPVDDLVATDLLYISDANHPYDGGYGYVRVSRVNHYPSALGASILPEIDLNGSWPFPNGLEGLDVAGPQDRLYVASGIQSFDAGYLGLVNTANHQLEEVLELTYGDKGSVLVDRYDPNRVFIATFDGFYNDPDQALYLNLVYEGQVVDRLGLLTNFDEYAGPRGMVFDPLSSRLYLTADSKVIVVKVNYGADPPPEPVTQLIIPDEGGALASQDGTVQVQFLPGSVTEATLVTYTESDGLPTGELEGLHFFDLTAIISGTTTTVSSFSEPYTLTVAYSDPGPIIENTLGLYWWDGSQWELEPTSSLDLGGRLLTASLDHMTPFAVLGDTNRNFLPLIRR